MRSILRSLTFGLAATLAGASSAQYPYTIVLQGTISDCYPGQTVNVQTVQGTQPAYNFDVPVDSTTCSWTAFLGVSSNPAFWQVNTMCNGMIIGTSDGVSFNFIQDSSFVNVTLNCGLSDSDGDGFLDNVDSCPFTPGLIGWACDDGNPATLNDVLGPDCICAGAETYPGGTIVFEGTLSSCVPGQLVYGEITWLDTNGTPVGVNPVISVDPNTCTYTGSAPYDVSLDGILNVSVFTVCDNGNEPMEGTVLNVADLFGVDTVVFNLECAGEATDCTGIPGGPNQPGTWCIDFFGDTGVWSVDCICVVGNPDTDCEGNPGGGALPGTPCIIPGTTLEGIWSPNCVCEANNPDPCQADFWVVQAMGSDSLPVPYELWVWNLSSGGSGNFSFNWNFGDGTSSTEAFPTHTYAGNGPYVLCLTIVDNNACTSTHCDSISINGDGIYEGMVVHAEDRQDGFTINVQNPNANAVQELVANSGIALWPNPAANELNVAVVSGMKGLVTVTITDLDGRTVKTERATLGGGRSQLRIATSGLNAGMYMLRITDGSVNVSQRFVKTN